MSRSLGHTVVVQQAPSTSGLAIAGLVFSILGWFTCGLLCIPGALLCLLALFARGPKGTAIAGLIVGFPGTLFFLFVGLGIILSALGLGAAATSAVAEAERAQEEALDNPPDSAENEVESPDSLAPDTNTNASTVPSGTAETDTPSNLPAASQDGSDSETNAEDMEPSIEIVKSPEQLQEEAKWHTWTTANGKFSVNAKFVKLASGILTLEKQDGTTVDVKLDILSKEDQDFVLKRKWRNAVKAEESISSNDKTSAEVLNVQIIPSTPSTGASTRMVITELRNTGSTVIRAVDADILLFDASGRQLSGGATNYTIYAVSDSSPGVAPGETYRIKEGEGFILGPSDSKAKKAEVRITRVLESGAF